MLHFSTGQVPILAPTALQNLAPLVRTSSHDNFFQLYIITLNHTSLIPFGMEGGDKTQGFHFPPLQEIMA